MALETFNIDDDLWQQFNDQAEKDKYTASALLKALIDAYLGGQIKPTGLSGGWEDVELIDSRIEAHVAPLQARIEQLEAQMTALLNIKFRR